MGGAQRLPGCLMRPVQRPLIDGMRRTFTLGGEGGREGRKEGRRGGALGRHAPHPHDVPGYIAVKRSRLNHVWPGGVSSWKPLGRMHASIKSILPELRTARPPASPPPTWPSPTRPWAPRLPAGRPGRGPEECTVRVHTCKRLFWPRPPGPALRFYA